MAERGWPNTAAISPKKITGAIQDREYGALAGYLQAEVGANDPVELICFLPFPDYDCAGLNSEYLAHKRRWRLPWPLTGKLFPSLMDLSGKTEDNLFRHLGRSYQGFRDLVHANDGKAALAFSPGGAGGHSFAGIGSVQAKYMAGIQPSAAYSVPPQTHFTVQELVDGPGRLVLDKYGLPAGDGENWVRTYHLPSA